MPKKVFLHELGHVFDMRHFYARPSRERRQRLVFWPAPAGEGPPDFPRLRQWFAEVGLDFVLLQDPTNGSAMASSSPTTHCRSKESVPP